MKKIEVLIMDMIKDIASVILLSLAICAVYGLVLWLLDKRKNDGDP